MFKPDTFFYMVPNVQLVLACAKFTSTPNEFRCTPLKSNTFNLNC